MGTSETNPRPGAPNHDLLRVRMSRFLSRDALARQSGVSSKTIRDIEKGRVLRPHMETKKRLTKALNLGVKDDAHVEAFDIFPVDREA